MGALAKSSICVGLDTDGELIADAVGRGEDAVLTFNRAIIDATVDLVGAYKPNFAFYEALGPAGMRILADTVSYIQSRSQTVLTIADAKRGDISNTARMYAKSILTDMDFDSVTVSPYMGLDSVEPFIEDESKGAFVLCLTSNPGAADFQVSEDAGEPLFIRVARRVCDWNLRANCGLVVGATQTSHMRRVRKAAPELPFLIPGVGAQGGSLAETVSINRVNGVIHGFINVSRSVLYASKGDDFAEAARKAVMVLQQQINDCP